MRLLYTKRSPYARKVRAALIEKGISVDLVDENLQDKSALLKSVNPLGKIPTLILDDGQIIYDSHVICVYLDEIKPSPRLIPTETQKQVEVLKWEALADDLMTTAINAYMEKTRHPKDFHADFVKAQENAITKAFGFMTENLQQLKEFNLAPIAVASAIGYIHFRLPHLKVTGALAAWFEDINQRPSMAQTLPVA